MINLKKNRKQIFKTKIHRNYTSIFMIGDALNCGFNFLKIINNYKFRNSLFVVYIYRYSKYNYIGKQSFDIRDGINCQVKYFWVAWEDKFE